MSWVLLVLGLGLWWGAHLWKRLAPDSREAMGPRGKGAVAGALVIAILLMIFGYRGTAFVNIWYPPAFFTHINNLLVLIAFYFMSPAPKKGKLFHKMRHPMLTGFGLWAIAHLLVNGDLASIVMFGGLWLWSIAAKIAINRAEPEWIPNPPGTIAWDLRGLGGAVVLVLVVGLIHGWIGPWPFGG